MTQPDGAFPEKASNYSSLAAWAATTQEEWESGFRQDETDRWGSVLDGLFDGLEQGVSFGLSILSAIAKKILGLDPTTFFESVEDVLEALGGLDDLFLGENSPLNAANLFGTILPALLTRINVGSLTNQRQNLLPEPGFPPESIISNDGSLTVYTGASASRSADGTGCSRLIADGRYHAFRSGRKPDDKIAVAAGQEFLAEINVRHSGYVGNGETVLLHVVPFDDAGTALPPVKLDGYSPTATNVSWPGHKMAGSYTVPNGVVAVQIRALVLPGALAGVLDFDDGFAGQGQQASLFQLFQIEGLPENLLDIRTVNQLVIDTIVNAMTGAGTALNTIPDLLRALLNIPAGNVGGVGGPGDMAETVREILAGLVGGASGADSPTGGGIADLFNILKVLSAAAAMGESAFQMLSQRNNTDLEKGLLPSGRANYSITSVNTTLSATQSSSLISRLRVKADLSLGVVSWLGCGTSGMTAFYMNINKLNPATGAWDLVHHSPNILDEIVPGSTPDWNFYQLATPINQLAGETYEYEWVPVGGTHYVRGMSTEDDIPDHPYAQVVGMAATRNHSVSPDAPPASIAKSAVQTSGNIAWVETAIDTGSGIGHYDDISLYVPESGTIPVPAWVNFIDLSAVGGAGGGMQGTIGFHGEPGSPGLYKSVTWRRGEHFGDNAVLTFIKGKGGTGGFGAGADGTPSVWSVPGFSITAEPGIGGTQQQLGPNPIGRGPGAYSYKGEPINAGGDQKMTGGNGVPPGGAGNGGSGLLFQPGGDGADGAGWARFRQNPLEDEDAIGGPTVIRVPGADSAEASGVPTISGGLSELPLEDQAAIDAIVAANLTAPGAVLSIAGPKGAYRKAYGKAAIPDPFTNAPARDISVEDKFRIGSASKMFTATMIFQAADRGDLSLDDPLEKYIPGVPGGDKVTIRNMLTMRSGLFNEQTDLGMMFRYFLVPTSDWSDEQTLDIVKSHPLGFEPGTQFAYTNSNFILLGMIVEKVTGRKMRDVLQTDVLDPLGLHDTSWPTDSKMPEPYAKGHSWATGIFGGGNWVDATETNPGYAGAAGGLVSTVDDMLIWCREMRDGNLISAEMHAVRSECIWREPWTNDDQLTYMGYGHALFQLGKWRGHAGSWRGYECSVYYLEDGTLFALMENAQTPIVESEVSLMFKIGEVLDSTSMDVPDYKNIVFGAESKSAAGKPIIGNLDVKFDNKSTPGVSQYEIPEFTIGTDANIVFAVVAGTTGVGLSGMSVKCGGVTMNRLPEISNGSDRLAVFWLMDPPQGPEAIKLLQAPYGTVYATGAVSYGLASAAGIGTPVVAQGYGPSGSVSATSHAQGKCFNAFFYAGQMSSYNQTERGHVDAVAFGNRGLIFGDAPGGAATFTLDLTGSASWIGVAIPIISNAE